jgi:acetyl esterase/lipase
MPHLIWPEGAPYSKGTNIEGTPTLTRYLIDSDEKHGAVIIFPGGGYHHLAAHEGEPVAKWLNSIGISAFVLHYRVSPDMHPAPMLDAKRAIRYVRYHADHWNLDKQKIGVLGFSAGGHLASTVSTLVEWERDEAVDRIDEESSRPDISILCYPVISFLEHYHQGSITNLLGEGASENSRMTLSNERNVSPLTPPTFLWHTADDKSVPVENSLAYAKALSQHKIPYEMHIFPHGRHGLGLAQDHPSISQWTELCKEWLKKQGF